MISQTFFITEGIVELAHITLLIASITGILKFRQLPSSLHYLVFLLGLEVVTEIAGTVLRYQHHPNLFINPIFLAGEFWLLSLVYDKALQSPAFFRLRPWLAGGFVAYCALDSLFAPEVARFKPALQVLESVLILSLVGLFFRQLLQQLRVTRLTREPMFWVSTGLLIKNLGAVQIFLFSNYLLSHYSQQLNLNIWAVHALLLVILYSCYGVALWIHPRK